MHKRATSSVSSSEVCEQTQLSTTAHRKLHPMVSEKLLAGSTVALCNCCPYGYHIDVTFVSYARDAACRSSFRDHLAKRLKPQPASSELTESCSANGSQLPSAAGNAGHSNGDAPTSNGGASNGQKTSSGCAEPREAAMFSPAESLSVFSDSLENIVSDFDDTAEVLSTRPSTINNERQAASKHRDYSSDYECFSSAQRRSASTGPTASSQRGFSVADGYASDFSSGYAVPLKLSREIAATTLSSLQGPTLKLTGEAKLQRPATLGFVSSDNRITDCSMQQRVENTQSESVPMHSSSVVGVNGVSAFARTGSVKLCGNDVAPPYRTLSTTSYRLQTVPPEYRGLSGQMAANMDSLAQKIQTPSSVGFVSPPDHSLSGSSRSDESSISSCAHSSNGADVLNAIKDQMSNSLKHMKDLEDQVKTIPALNLKISELRTEKVKLEQELERARLSRIATHASKQPNAVGGNGQEELFMRNALLLSPALGSPPPVPPRFQSLSRMSEVSRGATPKPNGAGLVAFDAFHSVRRTSTSSAANYDSDYDVAGQLQHNAEMACDDSAYVSDSELAFGERSLDRFASLRRSRRLLQQSAVLGARALSQQESKATAGCSISEFSGATSATVNGRKFSDTNHDYKKPLVNDASSDMPKHVGDSTGVARSDLNANILQTHSCRSEECSRADSCVRCLVLKAENETLRTALLKSEQSFASLRSSVPPPPIKRSVSTGTDARLTLSVGTSTPPLPSPKPCLECPALRKQVVELSSSLAEALIPPKCSVCVSRANLRFQHCGTSTGHCAEARDAETSAAIPCDLCEANKARLFVTFGVNTEVHEVQRSTAETMTDTDSGVICAGLAVAEKQLKNSSTLTESVRLIGASTATEEVFRKSVTVGTDPNFFIATGASKNSATLTEALPQPAAISRTDSGIVTDLQDVNETLQTLAEFSACAAAQKPCVAERGTETDLAIGLEGLRRLVASQTQCCDKQCATDVVKERTTPKKSAACNTEKQLGKSVHTLTDSVQCVHRSTDMGIKQRDAQIATVRMLGNNIGTNTVSQGTVTRGCGDEAVDAAAFVSCERCAERNAAALANNNDKNTQSDAAHSKNTGISFDEDTLFVFKSCGELMINQPEKLLEYTSIANIDIPPETFDLAANDAAVSNPASLLCPKCKLVATRQDSLAASRESVSSLSSDANEDADAIASSEHIISPLEMEERSFVTPGVAADASDASSASKTAQKFDFTKPRGTRATQMSQAAATKKLLTTTTNPNYSAAPGTQRLRQHAGCANNKSSSSADQSSFRRATFQSKSMRVDSRKGDALAYIAEKSRVTTNAKSSPPNALATSNSSNKNATKSFCAEPNTASADAGLKEKVAIKQAKPLPPSSTPPHPTQQPLQRMRPVPIRPSLRALFAARMEQTVAEPSTKEEESEATDALTPLPSEIAQMVRSWPSAYAGASSSQVYENPLAEQDEDALDRANGRLVGSVVENLPAGMDSDGSSTSSEESDDSNSSGDSPEEGSYDTVGNVSSICDVHIDPKEMFAMNSQLKEASDILSKSLNGEDTLADKVDWANRFLQHEWLKAAARKHANPNYVEAFLDALESYGKPLLQSVVNMCDQNENTALHYAVSHGNFDIVSLLLDAKVCRINKANKAGYTPVMLAALCPMQSEIDATIIRRLFQMGDVNIKASQHGQTALMLAVSHGRGETTKMLLEAGAGINIQDEDGSSALMCAAEHGHKEIVKLLLSQPDVDASLTDLDGSTALSIAVENGHRDIGVLIYAHQNYTRGSSPAGTRRAFATTPAASNGGAAASPAV